VKASKKYLLISIVTLSLQGCVGTVVLDHRVDGTVGDPLSGPSLHSIPKKPKPTPLESRNSIKKDLEKDLREAQNLLKKNIEK
jgi:hypothetical protein